MTEILPWVTRPLADVAVVINGDRGKNYPSKSSRTDSGVPFINAGHIVANRIDMSEMDFISPQHFSLLGNGKVRPNDLLFCLRGSLGKVALNLELEEAAIASSLAIVRPGVEVLPTFLLYYFQCPAALEMIRRYDNGTAQPNLAAGSLRKFELPSPSLAEQHRIVDILDEQFSRLDAALVSICNVRAKAVSLRRSLLHAAFSGEFSEGSASSWQRATLGQSCKVVSGATPKTTDPSNWNGDIAWLTPADLSKNKSQVVSQGERFITRTGLESCSARLFPAGSVMFTSRAPIGYVAIAGQEMCTNQGFKTAVPGDAIQSKFLYWQLLHLTPEIRSRASGTTFLEISGRGFAATEISIPPLDVQAAIVNVIEEQTSRLNAALIVADQLEGRIAAERRSLLHSAFTGALTAQWRETHHV